MESQFFACVPTKLLETPKERFFFWSDAIPCFTQQGFEFSQEQQRELVHNKVNCLQTYMDHTLCIPQ